jgi:3'(2'),5'-bisphosphate nucleotidase
MGKTTSKILDRSVSQWPVVSPDSMVRLAAIAMDAGKRAMGYYQTIRIPKQNEAAIATVATRTTRACLLRELREWTPSIPVICADQPFPAAETRRPWDRFWLMDPLDGIQEFVQGGVDFTVNVALIERNVPTLGVVYAPALDLCFYAACSMGSWKRDFVGVPTRIMSAPPQPGKRLRVVEDRLQSSYAFESHLESIQIKERIPLGSSLKFCWIAEGKADLFATRKPMREWQLAAGDCIFRNSGFFQERRSPLTYNNEDLTNPPVVIGNCEWEQHDPHVHQGTVLWFTGLSGAGKSSIATRIVEALKWRGLSVEHLDGDAIRQIFPSTGFTRAERETHVRRVGWVASRLERHGVIVVASLISPYKESRSFVRGLCRRFVEIHVSTPIQECERRDAKGLYAKARAGSISHFTGLDDPYESPVDPEFTIDTSGLTPEVAAQLVLTWLDARGL